MQRTGQHATLSIEEGGRGKRRTNDWCRTNDCYNHKVDLSTPFQLLLPNLPTFSIPLNLGSSASSFVSKDNRRQKGTWTLSMTSGRGTHWMDLTLLTICQEEALAQIVSSCNPQSPTNAAMLKRDRIEGHPIPTSPSTTLSLTTREEVQRKSA